MSTSSRFEIDPAPPERRGMSGCMKGCLITLLVILLVAGIGGWYVATHWREWFSKWGSEAIDQAIVQSNLPEQEQDQLKAHVDALAAEFREGKISFEQMGAIVEEFVESPLLSSMIVSGVESKYVANSGLTAEEKATGHTTLRRFVRGIADRTIDDAGRDAAIEHVADRDEQGNWQVRNRISDDDLRAFFAEAKTQADEAKVAEEPEDFDPSDELKRIIDAAKARAPAAK